MNGPIQATNSQAIRVILISSVLPTNTSAGNVVLHRHLVNRPNIQLQICENLQPKWTPVSLLRRIASAIGATLPRVGQSVLLSADGNWFTPPAYVPSGQPTVVLTVAHGDLYAPAIRYAEKHDLPLVTFFHDWWPDIANVTASRQAKIEKQFRELYQRSSLALCVSEGMREHLGDHPNSHVLLPIPSQTSLPTRSTGKCGNPIRVAYAGNLSEYGPMLQSLMEASLNFPSIKLEVRGANPDWPTEFQQEMRRRRMWLPFAAVQEFEAWMSSVDAFLIPQSFDPASARMMETNFPSKLLEMAQWGKPLVLWGPKSASGLQWNRNGMAVGVTTPDPNVVIQALLHIQKDSGQYQTLCEATRQLSHEKLNPNRIQNLFTTLLVNTANENFRSRAPNSNYSETS
ncbi:MAG: glycosyltransferase [Fuerstiella sp.]